MFDSIAHRGAGGTCEEGHKLVHEVEEVHHAAIASDGDDQPAILPPGLFWLCKGTEAVSATCLQPPTQDPTTWVQDRDETGPCLPAGRHEAAAAPAADASQYCKCTFRRSGAVRCQPTCLHSGNGQTCTHSEQTSMTISPWALAGSSDSASPCSSPAASSSTSASAAASGRFDAPACLQHLLRLSRAGSWLPLFQGLHIKHIFYVAAWCSLDVCVMP